MAYHSGNKFGMSTFTGDNSGSSFGDNPWPSSSPNPWGDSSQAAGSFIGSKFSGMLGDMGMGISSLNPITAGVGAAFAGLGAIGSLFTKRPNVNTKVGSYLDQGLSDKANRYSNLDSDYYKQGEEKLRRTMMDTAPTSNSLLSLAAATGGSATQAGLQRRASESKVGEGVRTGLLDMFDRGQGMAATYDKMNWDQAGTSMQGNLANQWERYNAKQQQWSNIGNLGGGLMGFSQGIKK